MSPWLDVQCVHEIDPLQIPSGDTAHAWDTAPLPRDGERYDAYFIAGYHGGHADLAAHALAQGAAAAIEKPIATTKSSSHD